MITLSAFADEIGDDLTLQMDTCQANGVTHIDVRGIDGTNVSQMTVDQARGYHKQMEDRGFGCPCIGSPIGKIRMDEDFEAHLDLLKHCFEVAEAFGTHRIRMFSFYPSEGKAIAEQREAVMERMAKMVEAAEGADCVLYHENEKAIYGARPEGVKDLFATIQSESFKSIFDPANYVEEGVRPYDDGWKQGLDELTAYFHIKDKNPDEGVCVPAGEGQGQIPQIAAALKQRGFTGYMTLEPHLKQAGQFKGETGPDLFGRAVTALKGVLDAQDIPYR